MEQQTTKLTNDAIEQRKRSAQLEFAEEAAYYSDRQNALAAVQIAQRLNMATRISPIRQKPAPQGNVPVRRNLAEILYLHATQSPHDTRFGLAWLGRTHNELYPDQPVTSRNVQVGRNGSRH